MVKRGGKDALRLLDPREKLGVEGRVETFARGGKKIGLG